MNSEHYNKILIEIILSKSERMSISIPLKYIFRKIIWKFCRNKPYKQSIYYFRWSVSEASKRKYGGIVC